jgi:phosphoglycerate dehydrogenase-like enzyme
MKLVLPHHLMHVLKSQVSEMVPNPELVSIEFDGQIHGGEIDDAEVIFHHWGLKRDELKRILLAPESRLRWVHTISAGVDHVLFPEMDETDLVLTNASGVFSVPIAETVLTYMLAVVKRMPEFVEQQREHRWENLRLRELRAATVGIVGLGEIGTEVARLCRAFGMYVLGLRRRRRPNEHADEVLVSSQLYDLLARSDFVIVCAPLTDETRGLIGADELAAMKPDAWLINIARGAIVDEGALLKALQEQRIGGACLDVFVQEPQPDDSPFWDLSNVIITPHNSWSSPRLEEREAELFLSNLRRYLEGEPLQNVVDRKAGY